MRRKVLKITSGVPLVGSVAFGLIDRGTNVIQVRPVSSCPLSCIFCSTDAGPSSRTRQVEYVIDLRYLLAWFDRVLREKGASGVEAHIDTVGDPFTYYGIVDLIRELRDMPEVHVISVQTHGPLLTEKLVGELERVGLDRINLSIDSLKEEKARYLTGSSWFKLRRVLEIARRIAESSIDLLIAPVWVPGLNDEDIPQLIEYALKVGAGKRWPALGIQKYEAYRGGRRPKGVRPMSWGYFYRSLMKWEEEFGVKLILRPEDFSIRKARRLSFPIRKGEVLNVKVIGEGWKVGETLAVARDRVLTVLDAPQLPPGSHVRVKVIRDKDNVLYARFIGRGV
ncbi:MAG: radical SAM protein [Candidatus Korarchaeum sp.]